MRRAARRAAMRLARLCCSSAGSPTGLSQRPTQAQGTESHGDERPVGAPHPGCITPKDVSRRTTMQYQACDIPLQIINKFGL